MKKNRDIEKVVIQFDRNISENSRVSIYSDSKLTKNSYFLKIKAINSLNFEF